MEICVVLIPRVFVMFFFSPALEQLGIKSRAFPEDDTEGNALFLSEISEIRCKLGIEPGCYGCCRHSRTPLVKVCMPVVTSHMSSTMSCELSQANCKTAAARYLM